MVHDSETMKQDARPEGASHRGSEFLAGAKTWWLFCLAVLLFQLLLLAVDPLPRFYAGESLSYLRTAVTGSVSEDLPYFYGFVVRWLCNWPASLSSLLIVQALLGAGIAITLAWICRAIVSLPSWLCYLFGFLCCIASLQLCWERYILPDTFSMFFYALVLWQSFVYLRARQIKTLLIIQTLSIITVAFGSTLLIPLQILAVVLPLIGFAFGEVKDESASTHHAVWLQLLRSSRFWLHLAVSAIAMFLLGQAYKQGNGRLAHREPAYLRSSGYSLLATWAPALRPVDSADPRLAEIIRHGNEFDLSNHALRNAQRYAPGRLIDRWRRTESDKRKAAETAMRTALNALVRDPGAIVAIGARTYYAFWKGLAMERLAQADLASAKVAESQQKSLLDRYHYHVVGDGGTERATLLTSYYIASSPYYFGLLLSPLLALVLLFLVCEKAHAVLLFAHIVTVFVVTFLTAIAPSTRSLQPLSLLTLLGIALTVKSLYPFLSEQRESEELPTRWRWRKRVEERPAYVVLGTIAVAALLRIGLAGNQPLWTDEVFTLAMATGHSLEHAPAIANPALGDFVQLNRPQSVEELRRYMQHENPPAGLARVVRTLLLSDTHPPLYYFLIYGWTLMFGTGDFALRAFSIICSLLCFPILVGIACRVCGRKGVVPSCLLFAFCPLAICYSTEGRMYSLLWLWLLAVIWISLVWTERGQGVFLAAAWVAASAGGFFTHYFFVFPWTALVIFLLAQPERLPRIRLVTCIMLTALVILPWYLKVPETLHAWRVMKDWIKMEPVGFNRIGAALQLVLQNFSGAGHHSSCNFIALVIFAIIGVAAWFRVRWQMFAGRRLLLWLLFGAACTGPLLFDFGMHTYTVNVPRYAIAALPMACLLAGEALAGMSYVTRLLLLVLVLLAWAPNSLIDSHTGARLSPRHRAEMVSAKATPTDLLIINAAGGGVLSIVRYLKAPLPIVTWLPVWVPQPTRRIPESIREFAAGRTRILWLAAAGSPNITPERDWLRANTLVFEETKIFSDFRPKDSPTF
ncbi:MAG TPA: glycosyltransferase family 39 protein [Chthoniobacterales bacterium]